MNASPLADDFKTEPSLDQSGEGSGSAGGAASECEHQWEWVRDWYGDPSIPNGTQDCSGWVCKKCDSTDCEDDPPEPDPDYDPREE